MEKRYLICAASVLFAAAISLHGQTNTANSTVNPGLWTGVIINSTCTVDEAFAEAPKCTDPNAPGGGLVLYDDTIRHLYSLDPATTTKVGDAVSVRGTL